MAVQDIVKFRQVFSISMRDKTGLQAGIYSMSDPNPVEIFQPKLLVESLISREAKADF